MSKKILALLLAFALVFSTVTVAFAEEATIGADAQIVKTIGMLQGSGNGVTAEYLATQPTRMQAAIMFLRLKGLEAEALAYTSANNFVDGNIAWTGGKNIMSYLKDHPELGWVGGDGGKFEPGALITAQQYYKVMLESLGYKQNTASVVGDFTWEGVVAFAAGKGLSKVASVAKFTANDLAIATVEALTANVKGASKSLIASLVQAGKVDKAKAITAGIYVDDTTTTAAVKAVKAIGNTKAEVEFNAAVEKAFAENAANYKVVVKDTTTALEVKSAVLDGTTKVVVETAAQTAGKAYTMTVGSVSKNFGGVAKDTAAAELKTVVGTDTEKVELTFDKMLDLSALNATNYKIDGVTVVKAAWADSSRKVVELTTSGMVANKTYKVTATDIKTVDLVNLKSASKNFMAKSDKTAPTANIDKTRSTNTRIMVYFNEEITKETAENLANYSLTVGSTTNTLDITAAKLVEDVNDLNKDGDDEDMSVVELTTAPQKAGTKYVLHVNNIADASVLANKITKEQKIDYYGIKADETKPTVSSVNYLTNKIIEVVFNDASRLDSATALDIANYAVNNDIAVEQVAFVDASNPDSAAGKTVRLTVSELGGKSSYTITISNITDEFGNVMDSKKVSKTFSKTTVNTPATVSKVEVTSDTTIKVTFTKEVNEASAKDVANYSINNGLGTPIKASFDSNKKSVTLTVGTMTANKSYEITINGVKDLADNVMVGVKAKFVASATTNDVTAPEIIDVTTVNDRVIRVTFDEVMDVDATPTITLSNGKTATYKVSADDDDMVLEFRLLDADKFATETDLTIVSTTAQDLAGNRAKIDSAGIEFSTSTETPENPELVSWEQTSVKEFKLIFTEKIDKAINGTTIPVQTTTGKKVPYELTVSVDKDDNTIVYLTAAQKMAADKTFELNLADFDNDANALENDKLSNYHNIVVEQDDNSRTIVETSIEDEDAPFIESVVAENNKTIKVTYSEDMASSGTYKITYTNDKDELKTITAITVSAPDKDNKKEVTLTLNTDTLNANYVYTLKMGTAKAKDIAGNSVDAAAEFDFAGTNMVAIANYITGVSVVNGTTIKVNTYSSIADAITVDVVYGASDTAMPVNAATADADKDTFTVTMQTGGANALAEAAYLDGTSYKVVLTNTVTGEVFTYTFAGIVETGMTVEKVGSDFNVSYTDAAAGDYVQVIAGGTVLQYQLTADDEVTVVAGADLGGATAADIMVIRNGVVIFYDANVDVQ